MGEAVAKLGGQIEKMATEEMNRINAARATEALNKLRMKDLELSEGPKGFTQDKLGNVGEGYDKKRMELFDAEAGAIAEGLSGPQREIFDKYSADIRLNHNARVMRHAVGETEKYKEQTFKGDVESNAQTAAVRYNDPASREASVQAMRDAYDKRIADGYDRDLVRAAKQQALSDVHTKIINNMLNSTDPNRVANARAYFDNAVKKEEIIDISGLSKQLNSVGAQDTGSNQAWAAFDKLFPDVVDGKLSNATPSREDGVRALMSAMPNATPEERTAFLKSWDERVGIRRDDIAQRDGAVYLMAMNGASVAQIKASKQFAELTPGQQAKVLDALDVKKKAEQDYVGLAKVEGLLSNPQKLAAMSEPEIISYAQKNNLGVSMAKHLLEVRSTLNNPSAIREAEVDNTELKNAFLSAGNKVPKENDEEFIKAKIYMRDALYAEKRRLGGRDLTPAERRQIYNKAMTEIVIGVNRVFPNKTVPLYGATPEDIGAAQALGTLPN